MKTTALLEEILKLKIEIEKLRIRNPKLGEQRLNELNNLIYNSNNDDNIATISPFISKLSDIEISTISKEIKTEYEMLKEASEEELSEILKYYLKKVDEIESKIETDSYNELLKQLFYIESSFIKELKSFNLYQKLKVYEAISNIKFKLFLQGIKNNEILFEITKENYVQILYGIYFSNIQDETLKEKIIEPIKYFLQINSYENLELFFEDLIDREKVLEDNQDKVDSKNKKRINLKKMMKKYGSYENPITVHTYHDSYFLRYCIVANYMNENGEYIKLHWETREEQRDDKERVKKVLFLTKLNLSDILMKIFDISSYATNLDSYVIEITNDIDNIENSRVVKLNSIDDSINKYRLTYYKDKDSYTFGNTYRIVTFERNTQTTEIKSTFYVYSDRDLKDVQINIVIEKSEKEFKSRILTYIDGKLCNIENVFNEKLSMEEILFPKHFNLYEYDEDKCLNPFVFLSDNSFNIPFQSSDAIPVELSSRFVLENNGIYDKFNNECFSGLNTDELFLTLADGTVLMIKLKSGCYIDDNWGDGYIISPYSIMNYYINDKKVTKEEFFTYRNSYLQFLEDGKSKYEQKKLEAVKKLMKKIRNTEEQQSL